jgi:hypothetical protein
MGAEEGREGFIVFKMSPPGVLQSHRRVPGGREDWVWGGLIAAGGGCVSFASEVTSGARSRKRAKTGVGRHETIEQRVVPVEFEQQSAPGAHEQAGDDQVAVAEPLAPQVGLGLD